MLQGYNILEFYTSSALQRWTDLENKDATFIFETNVIPPFFLISDSTQTTGTVQVFDTDDNAIDSAKPITVTDNTTYTSLKYTGVTLTGLDCGYYYLKIVLGSNVDIYYSEVFRWEDDVTDFLNINATSSNITLGSSYELDLSSITFDCYLDAEESFDEIEITEEGVEKPYGDVPVFNTMNMTHTFSIFSSRSMLRFLFGLRILETNGTITFTFNGRELSAYDIVVEKGDTVGYDESVIVDIKFKETNYISSRNV